MAAMSIDDFISTYIDFGAYNGLFPEEEIVLLKVAAAFYTEYVNNINKEKTVNEGWAPSPLIEVRSGDEGKTVFGIGTATITVPSGSDGNNYVPVGDIAGYQNATFAIYDSKMALVHELNHAILSLLGIVSKSNELIVASLASVVHPFISAANITRTSSPTDLLAVAREIRAFYGLDDSKYLNGEAGYADTINTRLDLIRSDLLARAEQNDGSYENIYNRINRDFYGSSGLDQAPSTYREGYVSHTNTGSMGPGANWTTLDKEWINYTDTEHSDYLNDPGRGVNRIQNGQGIAWLGNANDNTMIIGADPVFTDTYK